MDTDIKEQKIDNAEITFGKTIARPIPIIPAITVTNLLPLIKLSSETLGLMKDLYKSFVKDVVIIYKTASAALISAEKIAAKAKAEAQNGITFFHYIRKC